MRSIMALAVMVCVGCGDASDSGSTDATTSTTTGVGGKAGTGGKAGAGGMAGGGGSPMAGGSTGQGGAPPGDLCRFAACGGDLSGDWTMEDACLGGVLGACEARYPKLGPGGSLQFGCRGAFHGGFGSNVDCKQANCDCTVTRQNNVTDATYTVSNGSFTLQVAGTSSRFDYCVQGDVLTFGALASGSTPAGFVSLYGSFTARRSGTAPGPDACPDGGDGGDGAADAGFSCRADPDGGIDATADAQGSDAGPLCRDLSGAPCNQNSDCGSNLTCYRGTGGGFCTKGCKVDADCGLNSFGEPNTCVSIPFSAAVYRCHPTCAGTPQCSTRYGADFRCLGMGNLPAACAL